MKLFKYILIGMLGLLILGIVYQFIGTKIDENAYPPPGKLVDVGGYKLHINCSGDAKIDEPTIILDAGSGLSSIDWSLVQPKVAQFARVCSYDRAGMAWSEASTLPRTTGNLVKELHSLLKESQINGPYILVGHSFGGIVAQLFADNYPDLVKGIVLVDSAHEDHFLKVPKDENPFFAVLRYPNLASFLTNIGLLRISKSVLAPPMNAFSDETKGMWLAKSINTKFVRAFSEEVVLSENNFAELKAAPNMLINKPLIVISAGKSEYREGMTKEQKEFNEQKFAVWTELQQGLVNKSARGKQIIATKSGHMIPHDQPDIIVQAIREMLSN